MTERAKCLIPGCERTKGPGLQGYCSAGHRHAARLIEDPDFDTDMGVTYLNEQESKTLAEMVANEHVDTSGRSYLNWLKNRLASESKSEGPPESECG